METQSNDGQRVNISRQWTTVPNPAFQRAAGPQAPATEEKFEPAKTSLAVRMLDIAISVSLIAIFFGLPLFFTGQTLQGPAFEKQMYFYAWALLALVAWSAKGVISGEMRIRRTPLDIPILILLAAYAVSLGFSVDRWHSFWGFFGDPSRGFMSLVALVAVYYVIVSHSTSRLLAWMLGALFASNALIALWTLLALVGGIIIPAKLAAVVPFSLIGSVSSLSIFFGMMVPLLVAGVYRTAANGKMGGFAKLATAWSLVALIVLDLALLSALYSFVPWIAILVGVSFFLIYVLAQLVKPQGQWSLLAMAVFVAMLAFLLIGKSTFGSLKLPLEVSPNYQLSWEIAKNSLKEKMFSGSGPGTYGYAFSKFKPQEFNANAYSNLRFYEGTGLFFEAVPTLGLPGAIAGILLLLTFVSVGVYLLSKEKERNKICSLGLFSSATVFLVAALAVRIEGPIILLGALVGSLALASLLLESKTEESHLALSLKASPKFALALAFVFMVVSAGVVFLFVFVGKALLADAYAGRAAKEKQVSEAGSTSTLMRAIELFPREGRYYTRLGQEYMVLANSEFLKKEEERNVNEIRRNLNNSIQAASLGAKLMPSDVLAQEVLAQVYENAVFYEPASAQLAESTYQRAQELEPHNPLYFVKLGQLKTTDLAKSSSDEQKRKVGEAKELFQKSVDKKANYAPGYYQLSLAQDALGEADPAIESMGKAALSEPGNAGYLFNLGRLYQKRGRDEDNKAAEAIYKKLAEADGKNANVQLSLGTLYEKTKRKDEALEKYRAVLDLLPQDSAEVRGRVEKMISNVQQGIENTPETIGLAVPETPAPEQNVQPAP